jgi:hypothetical protein
VRVVITSGHPHSGYGLVHQVLAKGGIQAAAASILDGLTPEAVTEGFLRESNSNGNIYRTFGTGAPVKVWHKQATDLILRNANQENWGWAGASAVWALDFWRQIDEQIRFVLVYTSPATTIANGLLKGDITVDSVSAAVQSWIRCNVEFLRFSIQHPELCLLVNSAASLRNPEVLVSKLNDSFSLNLSEPTLDSLSVAALPSAYPMFLMDGLLEDFHEARALYDDLESAAHLADGNIKVRPVAVWDAWNDHLESRSEIERLHTDLKQLSERCQRAEDTAQVAERASDEARTQAGESRGRLADSQQAMANLHEQQSLLELRNTELTKENEILFMQLRQLQDTLDETVSAHRESERLRLEIASRPVVTPLAAPRARSHLAELMLDMRQEIDGKNWYWAEHDGRWAGPGTHATIRLPAMGPGRYEVNLEVVDAMNPEILAGMQVMLCGIPLSFKREGKSYPAMLKGIVVIDDTDGGKDWDINFEFPNLCSPAQQGSSDSRQLAIRLRSLRLRAIPLHDITLVATN